MPHLPGSQRNSNISRSNTPAQLPSIGPPNSETPGPSTFFESPMITLLAGPTRRRFWAHKDVLCTVPFFRDCLKTSFLDTHTNIIELPDDDPDAVGSMVSFLYSEEYFPRIVRVHGVRALEALPPNQHHSRRLHIHVHAISEKYAIPTLRDLAFRKVFLIDASDLDFLEFLQEVYTVTAPTSKLRYANRMEEYWVLGLHERIKEMRATYPEDLDNFLQECPAFTRDLIWSLSFAVDCALGAVGANMDSGWDYPNLPLSLVVYHSVAVTATTTAAVTAAIELLSLAIAAATTAATSATTTQAAASKNKK
ncbi:hypothetical protein BDZ91DRAFT_847413 [Kalaharituber pfeilii]|nr:hypothetical protein BDZ91DRAFT_847413 [Kalaharituber pfeilii]